ncbi:hypothetical protein PATA110616_18990 [Paenibacillus tarimensis]
MYLHKAINYAIRDVVDKRVYIASLMIVLPIVNLLSVLPISTFTAASWSSVQDLIRLLRFEFFFCPLLIILLGSLLELRVWEVIRKYGCRVEIVIHQTILIFIVCAIFTFCVFTFAALTALLAEYLPLNGSRSPFLLYAPEGRNEASMLLFMFSFYSISSLVGLLYFLARSWLDNGFLSAVAVISMVVLDRFTIAVIPRVFNLGLAPLPLKVFVIALITASAMVMVWITRWRFKSIDFSG